VALRSAQLVVPQLPDRGGREQQERSLRAADRPERGHYEGRGVQVRNGARKLQGNSGQEQRGEDWRVRQRARNSNECRTGATVTSDIGELLLASHGGDCQLLLLLVANKL